MNSLGAFVSERPPGRSSYTIIPKSLVLGLCEKLASFSRASRPFASYRTMSDVTNCLNANLSVSKMFRQKFFYIQYIFC